MTKEKERTKEIRDTEEEGPLEELRRLAVMRGVAVKEDANLEELLAALDPTRDMPKAPYQAVSKILERVRACEEKLSAAALKAQDQQDSDPNP